MKNIFASLARHFRKFANRDSGNTEPLSSSETFASPGENNDFGSFTKISPVAMPPIKPSVSKQPNGLRSDQARPKASELQNTSSFNMDYITREELKRELDLVRRLIESRK